MPIKQPKMAVSPKYNAKTKELFTKERGDSVAAPDKTPCSIHLLPIYIDSHFSTASP